MALVWNVSLPLAMKWYLGFNIFYFCANQLIKLVLVEGF